MNAFFSYSSASVNAKEVSEKREEYKAALRERAKIHDAAGDQKSAVTADTCREYANNTDVVSAAAFQLAYDMKLNLLSFVTQEHFSERPTNPNKKEMVSIYSFSKFWQMLHYLATGQESDIRKGDTATNAATLVALLTTPIHEQKKIVDANVNDIMTNLRRFQLFSFNDATSKKLAAWHAESKTISFGAGSVQSSSSINALRALGVVSRKGRGIIQNAISAHLCRMGIDTVIAWTYANPSECPMSKVSATPAVSVQADDWSAPEWIDSLIAQDMEEHDESQNMPELPTLETVAEEAEAETAAEEAEASASVPELTLDAPVEETAKARKARKAREARAAKKAAKEAEANIQEAA